MYILFWIANPKVSATYSEHLPPSCDLASDMLCVAPPSPVVSITPWLILCL